MEQEKSCSLVVNCTPQADQLENVTHRLSSQEALLGDRGPEETTDTTSPLLLPAGAYETDQVGDSGNRVRHVHNSRDPSLIEYTEPSPPSTPVTGPAWTLLEHSP